MVLQLLKYINLKFSFHHENLPTFWQIVGILAKFMLVSRKILFNTIKNQERNVIFSKFMSFLLKICNQKLGGNTEKIYKFPLNATKYLQ